MAVGAVWKGLEKGLEIGLLLQISVNLLLSPVRRIDAGFVSIVTTVSVDCGGSAVDTLVMVWDLNVYSGRCLTMCVCTNPKLSLILIWQPVKCGVPWPDFMWISLP